MRLLLLSPIVINMEEGIAFILAETKQGASLNITYQTLHYNLKEQHITAFRITFFFNEGHIIKNEGLNNSCHFLLSV